MFQRRTRRVSFLRRSIRDRPRLAQSPSATVASLGRTIDRAAWKNFIPPLSLANRHGKAKEDDKK
jgi:hypothetical protein